MNYKIGLIRTLVDRTRKINNTETGFQESLKLIFTLKRYLVPLYIIKKVIGKYNKNIASDKTIVAVNNKEKKFATLNFLTLVFTLKLHNGDSNH